MRQQGNALSHGYCRKEGANNQHTHRLGISNALVSLTGKHPGVLIQLEFDTFMEGRFFTPELLEDFFVSLNRLSTQDKKTTEEFNENNYRNCFSTQGQNTRETYRK